MAGKPSKAELVEKLKGMPEEDRTLFREALQEAEPGAFLSGEELSKVREMLSGTKPKPSKGEPKPKGILESLFGE
jgi:hypothetical protein